MDEFRHKYFVNMFRTYTTKYSVTFAILFGFENTHDLKKIDQPVIFWVVWIDFISIWSDFLIEKH